MFDWLRKRRANKVTKAYLDSGYNFGDAVSYLFIGKCVGFDDQQLAWEKAEEQYAQLGYRTISLDEFIAAGGYGKDINHLVKVNREPNEPVILHAKIYAERYGAKKDPANVQKTGNLTGTYVLPTTE